MTASTPAVPRTSRAATRPRGAPRRLLLFLCGLGLGLSGCLRPQGALADRLVIGEVMMRSEFAANLRALALPGGRVSGTPNAARAEQFVIDRLRAYGFTRVWREPFEMWSWLVHDTRITVLGDPPRVLAGAVAMGRTESTPPEGVTAEVVDLGEGTDADFEAHAADLRGKIVLVRENRAARGRRLRAALAHGAVGFLVMMPPDREPTIGNGHCTPQPQPAAVIPHDADLLARLAAGEPVRVNMRLETENWLARPSNIVAELPGRGRHANEIVILGAHLDGWHLGEAALDNGSGAAAILETARALRAIGWQPARTVRFVWFMGEEHGLLGSKAYVTRHAAELDRIVAMINVDMPGAPRKLLAFGHEELRELLAATARDLAAYELEHAVTGLTGDWSDHAPFMRQGIPTLAVAGELGPGGKYYHLPGDTYETVDRRGTVQSSAVLAVLVRRLADAPQRPGIRRASTPEEVP